MRHAIAPEELGPKTHFFGSKSADFAKNTRIFSKGLLGLIPYGYTEEKRFFASFARLGNRGASVGPLAKKLI